MEIKTIWDLVDQSERFDRDVNEAIADGWTLAKRSVLPGERYSEANWARRLLYAELTREEKTEASEDAPVPVAEPDYVADIANMKNAIRSMANACKHIQECCDCPVQKWCDYNCRAGDAPAAWEVDA